MIKKDSITILGYGSQGRAIALNLRDSGYTPTIGLRPRSKSQAIARRDAIKTASIKAVCENTQYIIVALPDHVHSEVLNKAFFDNLSGNPTLIFLHGSSIHFGLVNPPQRLPVLLLAPHAPGLAVRQNYIDKIPYSAFHAIEQGPQKAGGKTIIALAKAIGIPKSHLVKTTFEDEAVGDLFGEQAVLCGGLARLLKFGFETLVEGGLPKQNAYLEVAYQIDLIVSLVKTYGLDGMFSRISPMARYGSVVNGPAVITPQVKKDMKKILADIKAGKFIKQATGKKLAFSKSQMEKLTNKDFDRQAKKFAKTK